MNLKDIVSKRSINYKEIKDNNIFIIKNEETLYDINFLIPVRGRLEFASSMYDSYKNACSNTDLKITYTVIEHSDNPMHSKFCKNEKIDYIWINSNGGLFNKCLCYNMGVFYSQKANSYIFHDIDCLIQSDFFQKLSKNIENQNARAIQCFTGRRVLYLNPQLTQKVIKKEFAVDNLTIDLPEVDYPRLGGKIMLGAPGGSIYCERELFFTVGGYDSELFLANSPEDIFFWTKIDTIDKMYISNNPNIEIYHMFHEPTWMNNPHINEMQNINNTFQQLSIEEKKDFIKFKSELINEYK